MFGRFFLILSLLMVLADVYIFLLFVRKYTKNVYLRILWFIPSLLLLIGLYVLYFSGINSDARDIFNIIYILLALPKILFAVISILDLPLRYFFKWKLYPFTMLALLVSITVEVIVISGVTFGKTYLDVRKVEFISPNLPDVFSGYKIVQISDLHIGNWKGNKKVFEKMVTLINEQHPDVVMITGDIVNHSADELDGYEEILSSIKAVDGVYSILGNHDYGPYRRWDSKERQEQNLVDLNNRQSNLGWKLLNNEHTYLKRGGDSIALIGVENDGAPPFSKHGDLPRAMRGVKEGKFKILLSHDPTHWRREVLDAGIDLTLSGHTHASQFAIGSISFAALVYDEWRGLYMEGNQGLYINVGIGYVGVPFRFGAWPEITVITLNKLPL